MEIAGSLPCSQQPAICPNPEPNQPTPHTSTLFFWRSNFYILFSHLHLGLPSCRPSEVSPPKYCMYLTCSPHVSYAQSILFFLIWSTTQYFFEFKSGSCASRIFIQSPLISYFRIQNASLCTPSSITLSICSDLSVTDQVSRGHNIEKKIEW